MTWPFRINYTAWLPYQPLWRGIALNSVFYAAVIWLVIRAPVETRRRLRQWRGRCERCAYPVGASPVCTECGATIHAAAIAAVRTR